MERTQYRFSAVTIALVLLASGATAAEPAGRDVALKLRQNTVRIKAILGDETENGFGFIVGEKDGVVYAVTANHVVEQKDPKGPAPKVSVELYDHRGDMIDAKLLGTHDAAHDLAVITFRPPDGFQWNKNSLGLADQQKVSTEVWFVGKSGEWTVPVAAARIASNKPIDERISIEGALVRPGTSGAPLIASSGVVGMIVNDSADETQALSIDFIQEMFENWNHPFNLEKRASAAPAKTDGTETSGGIRPQPPTTDTAAHDASPRVEALSLHVEHQLFVPHGGGLAGGPGLSFSAQGRLHAAAGSSFQILITFAFPDGRALFANPNEIHYRGVGNFLTTGSLTTVMSGTTVDFSATRLTPMPYWCLDLVPTGYQFTYSIAATAHVWVNGVLVASSPPAQFMVRW